MSGFSAGLGVERMVWLALHNFGKCRRWFWRARDTLFIAKTEMAMGCRGVGGEEVGVKCGCMCFD